VGNTPANNIDVTVCGIRKYLYPSTELQVVLFGPPSLEFSFYLESGIWGLGES